MNHSLIIGIDRGDIESGNIDGVLSVLNKLLESPSVAKANCENIHIAFGGYDNDPRELFEIIEVRDFVHRLDERFPYWLYFCSKESEGLRAVMFCFLLPYLTDEAREEDHREKIANLLTIRWFPALNHICDYVDADEQENIRLTEATFGYFFGG